MKLKFSHLLPLALTMILSACTGPAETAKSPPMQSDFEPAPAAAIQASAFSEHGYQRTDNYYWLQDKTDPRVIDYLEKENSYTSMVMARTEDLQKKLLAEIRTRNSITFTEPPFQRNGYVYYWRYEKGQQFKVLLRKKDGLNSPEEMVWDLNKDAEGSEVFLPNYYFDISPDNRLLLYASNTTGSSEVFTLRVRDLTTGKNLPDVIEGTSSSGSYWAADSKTFFYVKSDSETLRPNKLYRHSLGSTAEDPLLYEEKNKGLNLSLTTSGTSDYVFALSGSDSKYPSEYRILPRSEPEGAFQLFLPGSEGVTYQVTHHKDKFFVRLKDKDAPNYKVMEAPLKSYQDKATWKAVIAHRNDVTINDIQAFDKYLSLLVRTNGLTELQVMNIQDSSIKTVKFQDSIYYLQPLYQTRSEYASNKLMYYYTSLKQPGVTHEYDMIKNESQLIQRDESPADFQPNNYEVQRLWVTASDGAQIPVSLLYKKGMLLDGSNPMLLEAYGAYGFDVDTRFSASLLSLVDRGFVYAIAHVRGGGEMGEAWAEAGKLMNKKNTFTDFIACAEELIQKKYTSPKRLAITGESAGGMLMGAVVNMRPDLFQVVVALVPFVDVLSDMLDPNLPLTVQEYGDWGNPEEKEAYDYIRSYSPYDNIKKQDYPNILVTAGLNDSYVPYHNPAKWVAKLRAMKTDNNIILLRTELDGGHAGPTGYEREFAAIAFRYAFILDRLGIN